MIKKKSAVEAARQKAIRNHELVLAMLDMTEANHFEFVVDRAADYLACQCGPDKVGQQRLLGSAEFWAWWRNHWNRRDAQFLDQSLESNDNDLADLLAYYKHIHSSSRLQNIRPHKKMMDKSFAKLTRKKEVVR